MELTDQEKEVFQLLLDTWSDEGYGLYGHLCYNDVFTLCDKVGVERPRYLVDFCNKTERKDVQWQHSQSTS